MFGTLKKEYDINGYAIVRNVIDPELVSEVENHVHWLSRKHPDTRPEAFHHNLLVHDPFIHHLLDSEKILDVIESSFLCKCFFLDYRFYWVTFVV